MLLQRSPCGHQEGGSAWKWLPGRERGEPVPSPLLRRGASWPPAALCPGGTCSEPGKVTHSLTGLALLAQNTKAGCPVSSVECFQNPSAPGSIVIGRSDNPSSAQEGLQLSSRC